MELIKIVRYIGSFILALFIVAIPFICALSYALDWSIYVKIVLTVITISFILIKSAEIYVKSEDE